MCGICGIYNFKPSSADQLPAVKNALSTLCMRGPEVQDHFSHSRVVLGHSRLSIIDTTEAANQPFTDESGRYTIVFNGEIYNFRQLRQLLENAGVTFHTHSDTEVLLKWIVLKGADGINDLHGFFAFAFYDREKDELLLARDRFGIKPFLYYLDEDKLLFASEMKALIEMGIPRKLDHDSMQIYFQLNYIPGPWSIYLNVLKLMPGHFMLVKPGEIDLHRYYEIPQQPLQQYKSLSYQQASGLLKQKLEEAVVKRLVADVPLGAFLSGGIDSSIIVALAAKHVAKLQTFSIGFRDEPMFDETHYAQSVAKMHNTDHTTFSLTTNDLLNCLDQVLAYTDEPFADSSALAVYILSRETRNRVTVALSGDGADEMFAGYNKHMAHLKALQGGAGARILGKIHPLLSVFPQSRNSFMSNKVRQLHRFGQGMDMNHHDRYWRWASFAGQDYPGELLLQRANIQEYTDRRNILLRDVKEDHSFNGILRNDMNLVLTNDMLAKVDMMSMANSLEVRVPFLDHEVVNLVFSLPDHFKIDNQQRKKILRDTFREELPAELYNRPKQGFEVPLLSWFRRELKDRILNEWLNDDFIREQKIFNPAAIHKIKDQLFSSNPGEVHAKVWALIVFQNWYKKYHHKI
jgi:asparagine synthase (glutamine-hydrolysing)